MKISRVNEGKRFVNVFKVRTGTRLLIWAKKKKSQARDKHYFSDASRNHGGTEDTSDYTCLRVSGSLKGHPVNNIRAK